MKPFTLQEPIYLEKTFGEIEQVIIAAAKKNIPASVIGHMLRDKHGIGKVEVVLGCGINEFLRKNGIVASIPEDLESLINHSNRIRAHLRLNKNDKDAKYRLGLTNSRLHRLLRYYKDKGVVEKTFKPKKI
ncbi:RS13 [Hepatospora eriocheir]|uniref:RS13 n=1 Tax=Hepatospora eriocheir TaxID=1081669 RepID=A0A1X0QAG5_9MICR|nr:RS13 [Hepatospora eriocheir]ORD99617.1 RS13 [Hepatospora eriocheir]